jgi:hypothetical protein
MKAPISSHLGFESIAIALSDGRPSSPFIRYAILFVAREWKACGGSPVAATNEVKQAEVQATTVLYILPESKVRSVST